MRILLLTRAPVGTGSGAGSLGLSANRTSEGRERGGSRWSVGLTTVPHARRCGIRGRRPHGGLNFSVPQPTKSFTKPSTSASTALVVLSWLNRPSLWRTAHSSPFVGEMLNSCSPGEFSEHTRHGG